MALIRERPLFEERYTIEEMRAVYSAATWLTQAKKEISTQKCLIRNQNCKYQTKINQNFEKNVFLRSDALNFSYVSKK